MRRILCILLILGIAGTLACLADVASSSSAPQQVDHWVHTASGWEWTGNWIHDVSHPRHLRPWVVATLQVLVSATALVLGGQKPAEHLHPADRPDFSPSPTAAPQQLG